MENQVLGESKTYPFNVELQNLTEELGLIMYKIISTGKKESN